jgi:hypothetical protein
MAGEQRLPPILLNLLSYSCLHETINLHLQLDVFVNWGCWQNSGWCRSCQFGWITCLQGRVCGTGTISLRCVARCYQILISCCFGNSSTIDWITSKGNGSSFGSPLEWQGRRHCRRNDGTGSTGAWWKKKKCWKQHEDAGRHHRWEPPHPHPIPTEEFIELQGRWATPEMEATAQTLTESPVCNP